MNTSRKILIFFAIISICITVFLIVQTYAKYLTATSGTASIPIAKWNIVVNNQSIKNNSDISSSIVPVFPGNDHIAEGIIAPTSTGYFDLAFDFSSVDVSFSYSISTVVDENSTIKDLVITGYSIDDGPIQNFDHFNEPIEGTVLYSDTTRSQNVRIYIMWNDDPSTSLMNNIEDTQISSSNTTNNALFKVNINFTQIAEK